MSRVVRGGGVAWVVLGAIVLSACNSGDDSLTFDSQPARPGTSSGAVESAPSTVAPSEGAVEVTIDMSTRGDPISPLILGMSSSLSPEDLQDAGVTLNSFGGNPSTRYNYEIGHAWNHGSDFEFRNTNYDQPDRDVAREFLQVNAAAGAQSRLAVPTLGWVARNDDPDTCSFPDVAGGCLPASVVGNCEGDGPVADPTTANTESTAGQVAAWVAGLVADGLAPQIIAMDNEPELWGSTHYDVHPECTTYEEILDKYLEYSAAVRQVAPDSQLAGPVMCCWYDYWDTAPGPADGTGEDFLAWFLRNVRAHDDRDGNRSLDFLDVHFYPQSGVYSDETDDEMSALRLRGTRSLWDPTYADESWISETIRFIPRMKEVIEENYPGTALLISEWNFGAEETMNGAVAIADVLGIYGREGVDAAAYWRNPDVGSPGYFAFKMHGNYDDRGSRFGGDVLTVTSAEPARLSAFAAIDEGAGVTRVMLLNKDPDEAIAADLTGTDATDARRFTYGPDTGGDIVSDAVNLDQPLELQPYSITVLEIDLG